MSESDRPGEPVEIATTRFRHEAELVAGLLEDAGVDAFVMADDAGGMYPGVFQQRGARVYVRSADTDRAREVLDGLDWESLEVDGETG